MMELQVIIDAILFLGLVVVLALTWRIQRTVGFDGDAGVFRRRPNAHCQDGRAVRNVLAPQQQHQTARLQQAAARGEGWMVRMAGRERIHAGKFSSKRWP